jgi:hypothetical protein
MRHVNKIEKLLEKIEILQNKIRQELQKYKNIHLKDAVKSLKKKPKRKKSK